MYYGLNFKKYYYKSKSSRLDLSLSMLLNFNAHTLYKNYAPSDACNVSFYLHAALQHDRITAGDSNNHRPSKRFSQAQWQDGSDKTLSLKIAFPST